MGDLLLTVLLLGFSAFVAGAETAFFHLTPAQRERVRGLPVGDGQQVGDLLARPRHLVLTFLILNEAANLALAAHLALIAAETFGAPYAFAGAALSVLLVLIFAETVPKSLALAKPVLYVQRSAQILWYLYQGVAPARRVILASAELLLSPTGIGPWSLPEQVEEDEIKHLVNIGQRSGAIAMEEREMILNVFQFDDTLVRELMTPRAGMSAFPIDTPRSDLLEGIKDHRFARVPIYRGDPDHIEGILYTKDLLSLKLRSGWPSPRAQGGAPLPEDDGSSLPPLREAHFVPETMKADELFREFQTKGVHMAIVLDEYGGVAGLVTMDDLLEELFGEMLDELDQDPTMAIRELSPGTFEVQGGLEVETFNEIIGATLPEDGEFATVAGCILEVLGRLPEEGEVIPFQGLEFKVRKVHDSRVTLLEVCPAEGDEP